MFVVRFSLVLSRFCLFVSSEKTYFGLFASVVSLKTTSELLSYASNFSIAYFVAKSKYEMCF